MSEHFLGERSVLNYKESMNMCVNSQYYKYIDTYVINNCISSLHSGLAIKELCMARDGGNLENLDYSDCLTLIDLLCVS